MCNYLSDFFDSEADFQVYRRNLPHWRQAGVTYFVTFHLADSLPMQKLAVLKEEKKRWLALNPPPHNENQTKEYHRRFSQRIHEWLDAGYGSIIVRRRRATGGTTAREHKHPACRAQGPGPEIKTANLRYIANRPRYNLVS